MLDHFLFLLGSPNFFNLGPIKNGLRHLKEVPIGSNSLRSQWGLFWEDIYWIIIIRVMEEQV